MLSPSPVPEAKFSALPRLVAAEEPFEDVRQIFRADAQAVVGHPEHDLVPCAVGGQLDGHPAAAGREFQAVVDQVVDNLAQSVGVAVDRGAGGDVVEKGDASFFGGAAKHVDRAIGELIDVHGPFVDGEVLSVGFGQQQKLVDQHAQLAALVGDFAEHFLVFVDGPLGVERHFDRALYGGQRRPQLVGRIVDELAVAFQIVAQQVEEVVDRQRQLVEFVARAANG